MKSLVIIVQYRKKYRYLIIVLFKQFLLDQKQTNSCVIKIISRMLRLFEHFIDFQCMIEFNTIRKYCVSSSGRFWIRKGPAHILFLSNYLLLFISLTIEIFIAAEYLS